MHSIKFFLFLKSERQTNYPTKKSSRLFLTRFFISVEKENLFMTHICKRSKPQHSTPARRQWLQYIPILFCITYIGIRKKTWCIIEAAIAIHGANDSTLHKKESALRILHVNHIGSRKKEVIHIPFHPDNNTQPWQFQLYQSSQQLDNQELPRCVLSHLWNHWWSNFHPRD